MWRVGGVVDDGRQVPIWIDRPTPVCCVELRCVEPAALRPQPPVCTYTPNPSPPQHTRAHGARAGRGDDAQERPAGGPQHALLPGRDAPPPLRRGGGLRGVREPEAQGGGAPRPQGMWEDVGMRVSWDACLVGPDGPDHHIPHLLQPKALSKKKLEKERAKNSRKAK